MTRRKLLGRKRLPKNRAVHPSARCLLDSVRLMQPPTVSERRRRGRGGPASRFPGVNVDPGVNKRNGRKRCLNYIYTNTSRTCTHIERHRRLGSICQGSYHMNTGCTWPDSLHFFCEPTALLASQKQAVARALCHSSTVELVTSNCFHSKIASPFEAIMSSVFEKSCIGCRFLQYAYY